MRNIPLFLPVAATSVVIAVALGRRVGHRLRTRYTIAWLLIVSVGVIIGATLTPLRFALENGSVGPGTCDMNRIGLAPIQTLTSVNDVSLNVILFIPLGIALGLLPASRARLILVMGAAALPFLIETTQLLVPALDRACESGDVVDNLTGLAIGLFFGTVARLLSRRARRPATT